MVISDNELKARLAELKIETGNPNFPFDPELQLQPCSIDLRLSDVIWKPRRFRSLDLSDPSLGRRVPSAFKRKRLSQSKGYALRPGEFILGRTYESFAIPSDWMGRLVGRSSLGRLGISVVGPSNFINPGWEGHMPLMLINNSPFTVTIRPYLGVVQLVYFALSSSPSRLYGRTLGSKYVEDDGGPSKYWLDHTVRALRDNLNLRTANPTVEAFLERFSRELDETTRMRLGRSIERYGVVSDVDDFIRSFVRSEQSRAARLLLALGVAVTIPVAILISWGPALMKAGRWGWIGAGSLAVLAVAIVLWIWRTHLSTMLSPWELRQTAQRAKEGG